MGSRVDLQLHSGTAYTACTMKYASRQYTIRRIPAHLDRALRRRARETGKSFNQVVLDTLLQGAGELPEPNHDLDFLIGTLSDEEAEALDLEIAAQRRIDPE